MESVKSGFADNHCSNNVLLKAAATFSDGSSYCSRSCNPPNKLKLENELSPPRPLLHFLETIAVTRLCSGKGGFVLEGREKKKVTLLILSRTCGFISILMLWRPEFIINYNCCTYQMSHASRQHLFIMGPHAWSTD